MNDFRIGHGFDVHRFADAEAAPGGITQRLGGLDVPVSRPLLAHSDGDVVLHAIVDAILGALGQGDIGDHFPDSDPRWAGADSCDLLSTVWQQADTAGYRLNNLDITIIAQTPRLADYKRPMTEAIAGLLSGDRSRINVKATTTEGLGYVGRKEGIAVHAVVSLVAS